MSSETHATPQHKVLSFACEAQDLRMLNCWKFKKNPVYFICKVQN